MFSADDFINDTLPSTSDTSQAGADAQLFSTLCEIDKINYLYLFERCKAHNINARQLRYLEKDHIRRIIPADQVGILAEFEYMHNEWKQQFQIKTQQLSVIDTAAATSSTAEITPIAISARTSSPKIVIASCKTINNDRNIVTDKPILLKKSIKRKFNGKMKKKNQTLELPPYDIQYEYPLDEIIPNDMRNIREEYKINGILTERERRRLAGALVDYFKENDIYMSRDIMDGLADQISTVFPTESKRAWHDTETKQRRGRLCLKLYNVQRSKRRFHSRCQGDEDEATASKDIDIDETTQDDAVQEDESEAESARIQLWLRNNKCEDNDELIQMWYETANYRTRQFKKYNLSMDGEHLVEIFENWPSYGQSIGNVLISIDFNNLYPNSENIFSERWPIFLQKIHKLYKLEIRSDLYDQYQKNVHILSSESKQYILINLLHSLVKPTRPIHPKQMARRYSIPESLNAFSKIIRNSCEMDDYTEPRPFMFVQGSLLNVEKVYVAFKDIRYEMKFMDALLTCMQIHQTFKIDFPFACYNFWILMQTYFFNITPEAEINMSVIDHIIKFLLS